MIVRSAYPLKKCASLEEALEYARKINKGAGAHADSKLEIFYNKKSISLGSLKPRASALASAMNPPDEDESHNNQWWVMVMDEDQIPGGKECAECGNSHFEDDYLCGPCRAAI